MARDEGDIRAIKAARSEFARRGVDVTFADIACLHGVMQIRGTVKAYRGSSITDIKAEMGLISRVLRQKSDIRDVILDCTFRT